MHSKQTHVRSKSDDLPECIQVLCSNNLEFCFPFEATTKLGLLRLLVSFKK